MGDEEEIVLSRETEALLKERGKGCHLCEWIMRTHAENGRLVEIVNFPIKAQVNHVAYEKSQK